MNTVYIYAVYMYAVYMYVNISQYSIYQCDLNLYWYYITVLMYHDTAI